MSSVVIKPQASGYVMGEKLGSGTFADVYKAFSQSTKREVVAIKCVRKANLSSTSVNNLVTEIELLKNLKHENIVEMKNFMWDDNYIYVVMEYCSGGDLSNFIRSRQRLPESICSRFLQQLACALQYMREKNISHLDLKPQNILLSSKKNPVLKIGDFGLAQHLQEEEVNCAIKGSPLYMAPEILLKHSYDAKVDLWSVGVILYECLFGHAPYSSKTFKELSEKIQTEKPITIPYGSNISKECADLLTRCLQRDPSNRIDFDDFFKHSFIDLEHKPGPESQERAMELLTMATSLDAAQQFEEAFQCYISGLQYLVPLLHVENDASRKLNIRRKVREYMSRTEELQRIIKCGDEAITKIKEAESGGKIFSRLSSNSVVEELLHMSSATPQIKSAVDIALSGEQYEQEKSYGTALEKYQLALGSLMNLLQNEPKGKRRELLLGVIEKWMRRAELVKGKLNDCNSGASSVNAKEELTSTTLLEGEYEKQCCIQ
ncbi:unc-51 like kinase 3 homolog Aduk [Oratosquilla oratoria]|uniref:unc-51 like kinase 3 homolog Aduk n=1 Tax=Oratosquilla oratoria TaxID=337810 RepID=UPI003F76F9C5